MSEIVVIAGMSGAGKATAANHFEDLGWYKIDNVPPALVPVVADLPSSAGGKYERTAMAIDSTAPEEVLPAIAAARNTDARVRVLFLDASDDALVRRYESTRRPHPFSPRDRVIESIEAERRALEDVKAEADFLIDTTDLNVHDLRRRIVELFGRESPSAGMQTRVMSFAYKHGLPLDVDMVIDCRFLPNPHWVEELRPLVGLDAPVEEYVLGQPITAQFLERLERLLALVMPQYVREGKSYFTIAFGCSGGRHRSVAIAVQVADMLQRAGYAPSLTHRDMQR